MATTTATGVANLALYRIGEKGTITDITSTSDELAVLCNTFYDDTRNEVQKIIPWSCLKTATTLSLNDATSSTFAKSHTLASTVLSVLNISDDPDLVFDRRGSLLLTNETSGYFVHTAVETTVSSWDPALIDAIAIRLASKICIRRTGDVQLYTALVQEYFTILVASAKLNLVEGDMNDVDTLLSVVPAISEIKYRKTQEAF